jgi:hypothetical protein
VVIENTIFEPWVEDAKVGVQDVLKTMLTFWMDIPDPNIGTVTGQTNPVIQFLQDRLLWMGALIMCFVVAYNVAKIMYEGNKAQPGKTAVEILMAYMGVAALSIPGITVGLLVTNFVSQSILELSTEGTGFADNVLGLFSNEAGVASAILLIGLYLCGMVIAGLMCIIMIGRGAALYVIVGALLTQAAAYGTPSGKEGFWTSVGWIKGLLLYKVVAAAIFGVGFKFLSANPDAQGNGLLQMLYGVCLLSMAVFALPATMRITAPATAPVAGGAGVGSTVAGASPMLAAGMLRR